MIQDLDQILKVWGRGDRRGGILLPRFLGLAKACQAREDIPICRILQRIRGELGTGAVYGEASGNEARGGSMETSFVISSNPTYKGG